MLNFAFFGTDEFAVIVLEQLKAKGLIPTLIVTTTDKPKGRKLLLAPPPVKIWAEENKIPCQQDFSNLDNPENNFDLFIVASFGKILKKEILDLPKFGALNVHPSLLPKYRGPSPIQTAILNGDTETGVSIMLLDEEMDHGPVLGAKSCELRAFSFPELRDKLARAGADLLTKIIPDWIAGKINAQEQKHAQVTYTKKIEKTDGEIKQQDLNDKNKSTEIFRKFLAYTPWPGIYFFDQNNKRVKITDASLENDIFVIKKVIAEGKSEMTWNDYERGLIN